MIVHLGTIVQTEFARIDEQGNVIERFQPMQLQISVLDEKAFAAIPEQIAKAKEKLCQQPE